MKTTHDGSRTQLLLDEREHSHGKFCAVAYWSQEFKRQFRLPSGWQELTIVQREALDMIALKIARIMCGDPNHIDHWSDVQGYAQLAANELRKESLPK